MRGKIQKNISLQSYLSQHVIIIQMTIKYEWLHASCESLTRCIYFSMVVLD